MRFLRALARLFVALAFVSVTAAQARDLGFKPKLAAQPGGHHAPAQAPVAALDDAVHQPCHPGTGQPAGDDVPVHEPDACRTACCFATAQLPVRVAGPSATAFVRPVQYVLVAQPLSGRAFAPDPEIPKRA